VGKPKLNMRLILVVLLATLAVSQALVKEEIDAKVKVCDYKDKSKCDLALEPEIEEVISKSRDHEKLAYFWREFYDKAGTPMRSQFERYVELSTKAAKLNSEWINLKAIYQKVLRGIKLCALIPNR